MILDSGDWLCGGDIEVLERIRYVFGAMDHIESIFKNLQAWKEEKMKLFFLYLYVTVTKYLLYLFTLFSLGGMMVWMNTDWHLWN